MAETEKKISELTTASQINDTDLTILSQGSSGSGFASVKATILAIANKIVSGINFTSALQTTNKTITGAINEVAQGGGGGSSTLSGLSDVDIDTLTLDDGQGLVYDETEGKWVNGSASGGGHTIVDNSGTSLAQEPKLKLNGMYVHDDSANQTTVGEYYREMTTAQYNQLSATEKQGAIRLTDNPYVCNINEVENADATHIPYDSNTSVKEKIDTKLGSADAPTKVVDIDNNDMTVIAYQYGQVVCVRLQFKVAKTYQQYDEICDLGLISTPFSQNMIASGTSEPMTYVSNEGKIKTNGGTYHQSAVFTAVIFVS